METHSGPGVNATYREASRDDVSASLRAAADEPPYTVAVLPRRHSSAALPRAPGGPLAALTDDVVDNRVPVGDAVVNLAKGDDG